MPFGRKKETVPWAATGRNPGGVVLREISKQRDRTAGRSQAQSTETEAGAAGEALAEGGEVSLGQEE